MGRVQHGRRRTHAPTGGHNATTHMRALQLQQLGCAGWRLTRLAKGSS